MPTLEEGLVAHLVADVNVDAVIGDRIYKEHLPQEPTYPMVVYSRATTQRQLTLDGPTGLTTASITVDCIAETAASVASTSAVIKNSLDGLMGDLGGTTVQIVYYTDEADFSTFDGDKEYRVISLTFNAILNE